MVGIGRETMEKLKIGIIGCGSIAKHRHIPEYRNNPHAELVAFVDDVIERAQAFADLYGGRAYSNYHDMFVSEQLDAVSVCTPNAYHAPISLTAMKNEVHVLCEKPMAISQSEAEEMIQTAFQYGVQLMIGYNQRLYPPHVKAKEIIERGKLGRVFTFRTMFGHGGPDQWSVEKEHTWFFSKKKAFVGSLGDLGVHKIDLITWLLNEPIVEVSALVSNLQRKGDVDDNASIIARTSTGTIGTITTSWTHVPGEDNSTIIYFENGTMKIATDPVYQLIIDYTDGSVEKYKLGQISTNEDQVNSGIIDAFIDSLVHNTAVPIPGEEGLNSIKVVLAALKSGEEKQTVTIEY
jgi:UDP-N-acetylglucosamine 3-dehydrogenase